MNKELEKLKQIKDKYHKQWSTMDIVAFNTAIRDIQQPKEDSYHKAKADKDKLRYDLIPPEWIEALAQILTHGAEKYKENTWQTVPDAIKRYQGAQMRHFELYRQGNMTDNDSKLPHLAHCAWNCLALLSLELKEINNKCMGCGCILNEKNNRDGFCLECD